MPVEPTEEMIYAIATGAHRGDSGKEIWSEALAYADDVDWPKRAMEVGLRYVSESDDHYVTATPEQMANLLREVVGIDIRRSNGCGYNESSPPQPIYDEAKERQLFEDSMIEDSEEAGFGEPDLYRDSGGCYRQPYHQAAWGGWIRCAQSRAKAGEVDDE